MKISLRRQLRFLQIYAAASFAVAAFLFLSAFTQPQRRITELTVERLNVVDANGTLRFVLSNKDQPLSELIKGLNAANKLPDGPARDEAVKAVRASAQPGPRRVFVGKNADKAAAVSLADGNGKPRLVMLVGADGNASIEFLDADGKVVQRIPASR